ncbi:hypothetical protein SAMN05660297_03480 [Natronincola peptidivorans]|uniref:LysM domain-containing protein n=1 Tax=Natronincola peptidivorans TaxID=426128 RepID=A0A1I0H2X8_9FIRM|nr:hypothetical protein SAMN05660297_03480 [Natronincola peptidivorans]
MYTQQYIRIPPACPPTFLGRYTVQPGDTFFTIAQMLVNYIIKLAKNSNLKIHRFVHFLV